MNTIPGWGFMSVPVPFPVAGGASAAGPQPAFPDFAQQPAAGGDFASSVRSATTSGDKRDLIDAFAAGFIAASRGAGASGSAPIPAYNPGASTPGLPSLPVGLTGPTSGVPTLGGGMEQQRNEAYAGVMEGFQHFAGLIEESAIPEDTKKTMLDGLAGLMQQFSGLAKMGANGGQSQQLPQLPPQTLPAPNPGSSSGTGASDVWTHEKKDDGTAEIRLGDKYTINLKEGDESFTVRNNETGAVTRVWGDPHVDKGADGKNDFDFKKDMTFQLDDGTKISVKTVPGGKNGTTFSSELTITNGDNAIQVKGLAGDKDGKDNLEVIQSNAGVTLDQLTDDGAQVIRESGKDWVDASGQSVNQSVIDAAEKQGRGFRIG